MRNVCLYLRTKLLRCRFWQPVYERLANVTACRGHVRFAPAGKHFRSCAVWLRWSSDVTPAPSRCDWPDAARRPTASGDSCPPEITWPLLTVTSAPTTLCITQYRPTTACRIRRSAQLELDTGIQVYLLYNNNLQVSSSALLLSSILLDAGSISSLSRSK